MNVLKMKKEPMLNVYAAMWCPHCRATIGFLEERKIPFTFIDIEKQPDSVVKKVIEVNGGDDWVVPTLEYNGKWREGKVFNPKTLEQDLIRLGMDIEGNK